MMAAGKAVMLPGIPTTVGGIGFHVGREEGRWVARVAIPRVKLASKGEGPTRAGAVAELAETLRTEAAGAQLIHDCLIAAAHAILSAEEAETN